MPPTEDEKVDEAPVCAAAEDIRKAVIPDTAMDELPDTISDTQQFCEAVAKMTTLADLSKILAKNNWPQQLSKKKADKVRLMLDKLIGAEKEEDE